MSYFSVRKLDINFYKIVEQKQTLKNLGQIVIIIGMTTVSVMTTTLQV